MTNEFQKRIKLLTLDADTNKKIEDLIREIKKEFPCLNCPSKDECENFNWYKKWFNY